MSAADRLAALDELPATELCARAETALDALVTIMNEETTLLRAGSFRQAGGLTPEKTRLAQDYVTYARSVQRQITRLREEAPAELERLQGGHERLATQMAENLKVIASARNLTDSLLTETAAMVASRERTKTYDETGIIPPSSKVTAGIAVRKSL
ncbi:hypothetical protein [Paradevosia shaoguanensis]|uniref:hypothetical protein n=1 Tax=Paradevosia shaoguanensis TaxID=1335043 RepID=UPI0005009358|nr:hypothetical protein [Paradevosia shaoguanensis]KFL28766.1 hypothetical protein JP74_02520 [Devosia sp. 17-2-E-8]